MQTYHVLRIFIIICLLCLCDTLEDEDTKEDLILEDSKEDPEEDLEEDLKHDPEEDPSKGSP